MFHYFNAITNTKGDALIGYYVKLRDSAGDEADIFADENSTPIISVSEVANAAKVDSDGNVDFYVDDGEYTLDIYATDATSLIKSIENVPMRDPLGDGDKGDVLVASSGSSWTVQSAAGNFAVAGILQPSAGVLDSGTVLARFQNTGASRPAGASGVGLELLGNVSNVAVLQAYNATSSANAALQINGSAITLNGPATFTNDVTVPDEAYGSGWNGSLEVPTKNAVYDKIEAVAAAGVADGDKGDVVVSSSGSVWKVESATLSSASFPITAPAATDCNLSLSAQAGQYKLFNFTTGGSNRFAFGVDNVAESGSDAGSNFVFSRYSDAGANIGTVMSVVRSTGDVTFGANVMVTGAINLGHASDTTIARSGAGDITIEGNAVYRAGGTDVPVTDGGTGASTAAGAATNLGLGTGDSPQFTAINLGHASDTTISRTGAGDIAIEGNAVYRAGGTDVPVADGGTGASDAATARSNLGINSTNVKLTESIIIACSDETTALTTGTAKVTFRMPYAFTLSAVRASVTTAPTGSVLTVDINESGTTILSTKLTIDASEKTSTTAATAAVISDSSLADDAEMTIDIDGVGSTIAGAGLKVYLIGTRT
jgi:hypothetical protein